MSKLWHPNPGSVTVTRQVTDAITTFSVPFARAGLIKIGGRGTIVKLQSGGILAFSPVTLTDDITATVNSLGGQVSYIVAPDIEHHLNHDGERGSTGDNPKAKISRSYDLLS